MPKETRGIEKIRTKVSLLKLQYKDKGKDKYIVQNPCKRKTRSELENNSNIKIEENSQPILRSRKVSKKIKKAKEKTTL